MLTFFLSVFFMAYEPAKVWADSRVRRVQVQKDQIVAVKTALGVATIVQVPDRPNSLVVGDQSAFKVEYLDQAITIKPIHGGARSNLYIYTDYRRFNVQLITGPEGAADYVVYLENPNKAPKIKPLSWMKFKNSLSESGLILQTQRLAKTKDGILLVEFEVRSDKNEKFKPDCLWLTQSGKTRAIHNLALSGQELGNGKVIRGIMQILKSDVSEKDQLKIELRRKRTSFLSLPRISEWK